MGVWQVAKVTPCHMGTLSSYKSAGQPKGSFLDPKAMRKPEGHRGTAARLVVWENMLSEVNQLRCFCCCFLIFLVFSRSNTC